jgi:hypothetical protein
MMFALGELRQVSTTLSFGCKQGRVASELLAKASMLAPSVSTS